MVAKFLEKSGEAAGLFLCLPGKPNLAQIDDAISR